MRVKDIIPLLQQCDPDAEVLFNGAFQGLVPVTVLLRERQGGIGPRPSWVEIPTVEISNGNLAHMRSQGMDVLGEEATK